MLLLALQVPVVAVLLSRLMSGLFRAPALAPQKSDPSDQGAVSVLVPTLNEASRLEPCLTGLLRQGCELREVLVVDSRSSDGTRDLVRVAQQRDSRIRLLTDDPLTPGWVGRPFALDHGFRHSSPSSSWILGVDADTRLRPGLIAALVQTMEQKGYDLVSLAPQFILRTAGEFFLHPSLLMTLVYRFGPPGAGHSQAQRVMANGQCMMVRRALLVELDGYTAAKSSFCDDVTLARQAAATGAKVGFLDGSRLLKVRMYEGMAETWREWGRSLDLKDASTATQLWFDVAFLILAQGLPWLVLPLLLLCMQAGLIQPGLIQQLLICLNLGLLIVRCGMQVAVAPSFDFTAAPGGWAFLFSPLSDLAAVFRVALSAARQPSEWRGRHYGAFSP